MSHASQNRLLKFTGKLFENPWFACLGILLLQFKTMWRIWDYRDLTPGDASEYFLRLHTWLDETTLDIVWTPLYTLLLAFLHLFTDNLFWISIVAQIIIATSASLLVLILFRRLLAHWVAWLFAAWWTLLPINFDTVYNVHLFSALFPLALFVLAAYCKGVGCRGVILAGLLVTGILVRTEYLALFLLWVLLTCCYEAYWRNKEKGLVKGKTCLINYGLPLVCALLIIGVFYSLAAPQYPEILKNISSKSTLYVCQNYAYSRVQQGDVWQGDPWTDCQQLIERDFGRPEVTFLQAFFLNPQRIIENIWWNLKLIPSGTQLALFNYYSGDTNPDFMRAPKSPLVWIPFLLIIGLSGLGLVCLIWSALRKTGSVENGFAWLLMFCAALTTIAIMLMVRPRPSYMFTYTVFLMGLSGLGFQQLIQRLQIQNVFKFVASVGGVLLIILVPGYYSADYTSHFGGQGQGWRAVYEQLAPLFNTQRTSQPLIVLPPGGNYQSLCNYLGARCETLTISSAAELEKLASAVDEVPGGTPIYLLYLEDMLWNYSPVADAAMANALPGYIDLRCTPPVNGQMRCADGLIDLHNGYLNDGSSDIPLRAALFTERGNILKRKDFRDSGYYLQVHFQDKRIEMIQVVDVHLFRSYFNRRFMLGLYDQNLFVEEYINFPEARLYRFKGADNRIVEK